jgi:hypothetical protein
VTFPPSPDFGINQTMNGIKLMMSVVCAIAAGCGIRKNDIDNNKIPASWEAILITTDDQRFIVLANEDLVIPQRYQGTPQIISSLTKTEEDSLLRWTYRLITRPIKPENFCTDYVGSLTVEIIITDQIAQQCQYSSVCEWSTLSRETQEMKKLLSQKLGKTPNTHD